MKVKDLPVITSLDVADLFYVVDDSEGVNGGRKITKANLRAALELTDAEVKTKYENNANTNEFNDAEKTALGNNSSHRTTISGNPHNVTLTEAVAADSGTNITAAELEILSNNSNADSLHFHAARNFAQFVIVAKSGGDYTNIASALSDPKITGATALLPALIQVFPGIYNESPFIMPDFVKIIGHGRQTILRPSGALAGAFITLGAEGYLSNLSLDGNGNGGVGSIGVLHNIAGVVEATELFVEDFETGIKTDGAGANFRCHFTRVGQGANEDTLTCYETINGGILNISDAICSGGTTAIGLKADNGIMYLSTIRTFGCTDAIFCTNNGDIHGDGIIITGSNVNALHTGSVGTLNQMRLNSTHIHQSIGQDIRSDSSVAHFVLLGLLYNTGKRSIASGTHFEVTSFDGRSDIIRNSGEFIFEQKGDIGIPGKFSGLDVGEGGSYDTDENGAKIVEYWSFDNSLASGSKFTKFVNNAGTQLADQDDAIYIGSKFAFSALRLNILTAMNPGANSITVEYWNGSTWATVSKAVYEKNNLIHRANVMFENIETQYIEHSLDIYIDWTIANDVLDQIPDSTLGVDMYWIRYRNTGGALTTATIFDSGKVRGDDFDVTSAKINVNWGRNRVVENILKEQGLFNAATNSPANNDINLSANITLDGVSNSFSATALDQLTTITHIPLWVDTSTDLKIKILGFGTDTDTGDIEYEVILVKHKNGDAIDSGSLVEIASNVIAAYNGTIGEQQSYIITIPIETFSPDDNLAILVKRDATAGNIDDTYTGAFTIISIDFEYTRKR